MKKTLLTGLLLLVLTVTGCVGMKNEVCVKDHLETQTTYVTSCYWYSNGICKGYTFTPRYNVIDVCDQWKEVKP